MRTTIDITDEQRGQLLELAARRGEKGFSRLVQEALDQYLAENLDRAERIKGALAVLGSLSDEAATKLETSVRDLRSSWR
jgi:metal-responsive CopG/Arc/MetJ family transcriptional regulator